MRPDPRLDIHWNCDKIKKGFRNRKPLSSKCLNGSLEHKTTNREECCWPLYAASQHMLQVQNDEVFVNSENFPLDRNPILNTFKVLPTKVNIPTQAEGTMSIEALSLFLFKVIYLVDLSIWNNSLENGKGWVHGMQCRWLGRRLVRPHIEYRHRRSWIVSPSYFPIGSSRGVLKEVATSRG